ncbi:MAG TPA: metallophosphoesterase family protein [Planctomycetota bacterium]|jgi:predicted phosphodiesterase|nr:metallophosphoesterase family protein [Planctomycetota bacterium]
MALHRRYGIISDIHANYPALEVVLDYLPRLGVEYILNLGDLIGYGAFPSDVLRTVMSRTDMLTIMGNHDRMLVGEPDPTMRKTAQKVLDWTKQNVTMAQLRYVASLPSGLTLENQLILVHASLEERDTYILTTKEVEKDFAVMVREFPEFRISFFGHTHRPMLISTHAVVTDLKETQTFQLDRGEIYLINPGSVGQPRDKCPLACFGVLDTEAWTMTFVRIPYDLRAAQRQIIENGLPEKFARRLALGT